MNPMTVTQLLAATGGKLLGEIDPQTTVTAVETDSRAVQAGSLFVALRGERTDGHRYVESALSSGAVGCLVEDAPEALPSGKFCIQVPDTLVAVGQVAGAYWRQWRIPVIGVTGSVGKTTTKDMIAAVLGVKYRVLKTEGNYNNELGLPLTLFRLTGREDFCILEMGMSALGEIDYLTSIAPPEMAVITNIGDAHIENLGSRENILKAKLEICARMKPTDFLVLCGDDAMLSRVAPTLTPETVLCGFGETFPYRAIRAEQLGAEGMACEMQTPQGPFSVTVPALGRHMVYPVLMAAAIGQHLGLSLAELQKGVASFVPTKMRMNVVRAGTLTILDDTYNANPQSMQAGLSVLAQSGGAYRVAVLGDMLELGDLSAQRHREVGAFAASLEQVDALLAVGEQARYLYEGAKDGRIPQVLYAQTKAEAKPLLSALTKPNTVFFVKASRGMAFEELTAAIRAIGEK